MLPLFYTSPLAVGCFWLAYLIWVVPDLLGLRQQRATMTRKEASRRDHHSLMLLFSLMGVGVLLNFLLAALARGAAISWHRTLLTSLGVVMMLARVALRWYAIWMLGRSFTYDIAVANGQLVVEQGPYRFIRHPSYSGSLLTVLGIAVATANWLSPIPMLLGTLIGFAYRVHIEEQVLRETLGQPYIYYIQRTRRFIPFVL